MMVQSDYEAVGSALRLSLPLRQRIKVYRKMVPLLAERNTRFNPVRFGESMGIPRLLCNEELKTLTTEKEVVPDGRP